MARRRRGVTGRAATGCEGASMCCLPAVRRRCPADDDSGRGRRLHARGVADRVKGLFSFGVIATAVKFIGLRIVNVAVPMIAPTTRPGPISVASLDDLRDRIGFAPIVPAHRPASLGSTPVSITVVHNPSPTLIVAWREGDAHFSITQRRGGPKPDAPAEAVPLPDVPESTWWSGPEHHLTCRASASDRNSSTCRLRSQEVCSDADGTEKGLSSGRKLRPAPISSYWGQSQPNTPPVSNP